MKITRRQLRRIIREAIKDASSSRLFHSEKNPRLRLPRDVVEQEIAKVIESFRTGEYAWSPGAQREFKDMALAGAGTDEWRFDAFPNWENKDFQTVIDAVSTL
jgi:hypothetical protein